MITDTHTSSGTKRAQRSHKKSKQQRIEALEDGPADPKSEEEIVFHLSANGEECKITFDHERRDYTMRWDMEGGKFISTSETLSQLMQLALEKFIKPRETAEGFIPGVFMS